MRCLLSTKALSWTQLSPGTHPLKQWGHGIQWTQTTVSAAPFEESRQLKPALRGMAPGPQLDTLTRLAPNSPKLQFHPSAI